MNGLPKPAYVMSGPHLSGFRVIVGYETLADADAAHAALSPSREEVEPEAGAVVRYRGDAIPFDCPHPSVGVRGAPYGYNIDPGAGSAMDRLQRDWPGRAQVRDLRERDGEVTPLFPAYAHPAPSDASATERMMAAPATGAKAVVRGGQVVISIDVDALPIILSGSVALGAVGGLWKVTDAAAFAKEVCGSLNAESENGTTRVHTMFDSAFSHAIEYGAEGVEEISADDFEIEAQRLQAEALALLTKSGEAE